MLDAIHGRYRDGAVASVLRRLVRRVALGIAVLLIAAAVGGALVEWSARRRAAREFPPQGRWVDVGGRRIQVDCRGAGSPTVVLESGLDHLGSLSWDAVHDSIAGITRVCAYSRAGILWSDAAGGPFDPGRMAEDLHTALTRAGERPPWVMAGHSLGGPYVMIFTARYPREVAGLVFVDASHPDQDARMRAVFRAPSPVQRAISAAVHAAAPALTRLGAGRLVPVPNPLPTWTPAMEGAHAAYYPTSVLAVMRENQAVEATFAAAGRQRGLGARPLVVLTAALPTPPPALERMGVTPEQDARRLEAWTGLHRDQATWSTRARHEIVEDAGHYIHLDRPDVVVRAVREVVEGVRKGGTGQD